MNDDRWSKVLFDAACLIVAAACWVIVLWGATAR